MSKRFRQCRYVAVDGSAWDESWLPEQLATVGKLIHFTGSPITYRVTSVGDRTRTAQEMHEKRAANNQALPSVD